MGVFPEANARLYGSVYVCRICESKKKIPINKFLAGKGVCRKCDSKKMRAVRLRSKK